MALLANNFPTVEEDLQSEDNGPDFSLSSLSIVEAAQIVVCALVNLLIYLFQ